MWALQAMFVIPHALILTLLAATSLTVATLRQRPVHRELWKPHHWLVVTHLLFFPAVIAVGVIWANPVTNPTFPHHPIATGTRMLDLLFYASLVSCALWVWRMKGFRWFATSLMLLAEVPVLCGLFIAGMSVAGDWL